MIQGLTETEAEAISKELVNWGIETTDEIEVFTHLTAFSLKEVVIVAYENTKDKKGFCYEIYRRDYMTSLSSSDHYSSMSKAISMAIETADHQH
jgi:hypothetical protein